MCVVVQVVWDQKSLWQVEVVAMDLVQVTAAIATNLQVVQAVVEVTVEDMAGDMEEPSLQALVQCLEAALVFQPMRSTQCRI